jgi:hypothetical protein
MKRGVYVIAFAAAFFLNSVAVGAAQEECTSCKQSYTYICMQNHGDCTEACNSIGATDKDACKRRCGQDRGECLRRAAAKCGTCWPGKPAIPPPARVK